MTDEVKDLLHNLSNVVAELAEQERADSFESDHNSVMLLESHQRKLAEFFFNNPAFLRTIRTLQADLQSVRRLTIKYHGLGMKDPAQWRVGLEEIASVVAEDQSHDQS